MMWAFMLLVTLIVLGVRWTRVLLWLVVLAVIFGCAYTTQDAAWPTRGGFICATNLTNVTRALIAQDGAGRALSLVQSVDSSKHVCARWPFIGVQGRAGLATRADTIWSEWFEPWSDASLRQPDKIGAAQ